MNAESIIIVRRREPWNKGKLIGQKAPLRLKDIWAIRIRLQLGERIRELAMFNLAVDSKLRSCDLVKLRVRDGQRWLGSLVGHHRSLAPGLTFFAPLVEANVTARVARVVD